MKRRLEHATNVLEQRFSFRVRWEPFLLHPLCPRDGLPVEQPIGGDLACPRAQHLKETGKSLGLELNFTCPIYPFTVPAHVLLEYAKLHGDGSKQNEVSERLFKAYFTKGRPLEAKHLLKIAQDVGFNVTEVRRYLASPENEERIKHKAVSWRKQGVMAIPFLFVNGQPSCSGAQDIDVLIQTITKAALKFPLGESTV
ncbi:unnamed protein product [Lymnaea stagnalis]|uniref:DSBA-like thioredoxin domain-containing protein n=1 Tax=Lymnaea stagnalis TaxID=6523 RepID=A0AAV2IJT6_LYMST